jgi:hypothetical protein
MSPDGNARIAALGTQFDADAASVSDGASTLDAVREFLRRFCAFPRAAELDAVTLWAAHAHMVDCFHTTPRLALLSPEPGSGKTRVLEILDLLVPEPMFSLNASPATVFRTLAERQITLLFDEVDAIWRNRGKDDNNEDLRALINAGYRRGATIPRCVGPRHEVQHFGVYCATALAGLGDLPDTVMSRAVIIRMRRRAPDEHIEPFRLRQHEAQGHALRDRLAQWAGAVGLAVGEAWPTLPPGIVDRPAEIWEPLLAIADAAGGVWPSIARATCVALCHTAEDRRASLGIRLLSDLRIIFGDADALHTETILKRLCAGEEHGLDAEAPWAELHGKPIGSRTLATMLARYGIKPQKVTIGGRSLQGYRRSSLWEAWQRYLPSPMAGQPELPELPESVRGANGHQIPEVPGSGGNGCASGIAEIHATAEPVPRIPDIPHVRRSRSTADRITEAARLAAIPVELLHAQLSAADLADPQFDLLAYARGLARESEGPT